MEISAISVPIKKFLFLAFGKLWLMDPIRNFVYQWAWSLLRSLPKSAAILDIGTRNSRFAAWCAWRGFSVTAIDKDARFLSWQEAFKRSWHVEYQTIVSDVAALDQTLRFDGILALFSLQHAGEGDIAAYRRAFSLLKPGGIFIIVNEYDPERTKFQPDRDDGALRIYGPSDIAERIEKPLIASGAELSARSFARADFRKGSIHRELAQTKSNVCLMVARKPTWI
jgi:SAM-dependent methyltransferase